MALPGDGGGALQTLASGSLDPTAPSASSSAAKPEADLAARQAAAMAAVENLMATKSTKTESSAMSSFDFGAYTKKVLSFLARNFFTMKFIALAIAFIINFMLLFYKVRTTKRRRKAKAHTC